MTTENKNIDPKLEKGKVKVSYHNIPFHVLEILAEVMTTGLRKYGRMTWRREMDIPAYRDSLMRHIVAYMEGDVIDKDSGFPHLAHAMANVLILMDMETIKENKEKNK